jgi:DNA-directed RNA polymerase II subunit RPB2
LTKVTNNIPSVYVIDIIDRLFTSKRTFDFNGYCVFVNGIWIGSIDTVETFIERFKELRCLNIIPCTVSISVDDVDKEVHIFSDSGRILRPLIVAKNYDQIDKHLDNTSSKELWDKLIDENIIIYIDGNEQESSMIAMWPNDYYENPDQFDYIELHPSLMLGICSSTIPYSEHSQNPRNVYVSSMMKQAIGTYSLAYRQRFDTIAHVLNYPQKKLVNTRMAVLNHCEDMNSGMNPIVAIKCELQNQEDSIVVNKSAIDRGLFHTVSYKTTSINENKKGTHDSEIIQLPPLNIRNNNYNYSKLDENGIVVKNTKVVYNDVLVGKVYNVNEEITSDCSLICKSNEEGIVDTIFITINASGYKHIKIKIRQIYIPEVGDKLASIHGQKGTIGGICNQEDMPFTAEGISPDLIVNANCLPSRMTINMLLEMLTCKAGCFSGKIQDATTFDHDGYEVAKVMGNKLVEAGYERMGTEIMYNGQTGMPFKAKIFIAPVYYQRLKHLVASKIHARGFGNVQLLSRQPTVGRSKDGGLRFGEMEKDCAIAHGISAFLKERLFDLSDPYQLDICPECGTMVNSSEGCMMCGHDITTKVNMPYACKLLFQELQAMGVKINLKST